MNAPVIGVLLRPWAREGKPRRVMQDRAYFDVVVGAGAIALPVPVVAEPALRGVYDLCDGLLLPGGKDVDPGSYEVDPAPDDTIDSHAELDGVEGTLLGWAWHDRLPVLGICRGLHAMNVARGGTLWHDLERDRGGVSPHNGAQVRHEVEVAAGSVLAGITGCLRATVNSRHHQGVREMGAGLRVVATCRDGVVEGMEADDGRFHLGVQWHPEDMAPDLPGGPGLVAALVAAAHRAARPRPASA